MLRADASSCLYLSSSMYLLGIVTLKYLSIPSKSICRRSLRASCMRTMDYSSQQMFNGRVLIQGWRGNNPERNCVSKMQGLRGSLVQNSMFKVYMYLVTDSISQIFKEFLGVAKGVYKQPRATPPPWLIVLNFEALTTVKNICRSNVLLGKEPLRT